ncbi:hypothetical protein GCM10027341_04320 [Spirosoma knui]
MMNRFIPYLLITVLFSSCSYTKNWQGTSTPQRTQADFNELTGKQVFTLHVPSNNIYLAYQFSEPSGHLEATLKSSSELLFDKPIKTAKAGSTHLLNQKGTEYAVSLKGRRASGKFDVKFVSAPQ